MRNMKYLRDASCIKITRILPFYNISIDEIFHPVNTREFQFIDTFFKLTFLIFLPQYFLASSNGLKKCFQWLLCKRGPKNKYKVVIQEMDDDPSWPPVGVTIYGSPET